MIHRAIGIHLQKILPKLVPKTDAEVDALLDCKLRVYVVHILHILHIWYILHIFILCMCQAEEEHGSEHGSGREGTGAAAVIPAAGIMLVFRD